MVTEKSPADKLVRNISQDSTRLSSRSDVPSKQDQQLLDQFQLLEATGEGKDILLAIHLHGEKRGVWVQEQSRWVKQCDVPKQLPEYGVCFCAVADGLVGLGGKVSDSERSSVCYHYSLSQKKWWKVPDMMTPKSYASAVEISPMVVMVVWYAGDCEVLDINKGEWSHVKPLQGFMGARVAAGNGRVFVMGVYCGHSGSNDLPGWSNYELVEYHPSSDTYTATEVDIPISSGGPWRFHCSDMVYVAGKLYLVGEINLEIDLKTKQAIPMPDPNTTQGHFFTWRCCPTVKGNDILLCGGVYKDQFWGMLDLNSTCCQDAIEEYNTATKQWEMSDYLLPFRFWTGTSFVTNISV